MTVLGGVRVDWRGLRLIDCLHALVSWPAWKGQCISMSFFLFVSV